MRQGLKWQITWARMPGCQNNIYLLFVTCVSISKARLSDLFGIRALFISTFPPEKKKKKRSDFKETEGNEAFTWGQPEKDKLTQVSDSMQCSIFNKQALSIFSQRVLWPCWIFNAEEGWRDRDTFPNRVGDRQKKKSGREGEKENTSCMSPLLIPTSPTQNQSHGGSVNDLELPSEMPVLKESFWCVCQMPFPPTKKDNCFVTKLAEYFCLS